MTTNDPTGFLYAGNQVYIAELYERYLDDPGSVDRRWQEFFEDLSDEATVQAPNRTGASWAPSDTRVVGDGSLETLSEQMERADKHRQPAYGAP